MEQYRVHGKVCVDVYVELEADSKEEAIDSANCELSELTSFFGNGGYDKLIGVYGGNQSIESCGTIVYEDVEEI